MNIPMYKKGNRLAWIGFILAIIFTIPEFWLMGQANGVTGLAPSLLLLFAFSSLARVVCVAIIIWGAVLALKAKNRSMWWLLLVAPGLFGGGLIILVAILFMLKDKSTTPAPAPSAPTPVSNTPVSPQ